MYCTCCGRKMGAGHRFCTSCGARAHSVGMPKRKKSIWRWLWIPIAAVVLLNIIGIVSDLAKEEPRMEYGVIVDEPDPKLEQMPSRMPRET